ncbi:phosphatidylserine decarboxylase [Alterisphingorhabdus coralli]|uniref:Phosphatidylserine decarboxylase proenzyme n=1 Tax=Alterisphingorhabdus coralli TaxID=3071408 RepID=A0AA97F5E7_9SPHN|nr:phosphatidylserine decarboxylase [Parasphingorhabdus sp. SCSIO 66989]WOE74338.1 phosphatidylserine decarboxylase [Parasphingorhabdus sp. SCSIO 66989]
MANEILDNRGNGLTEWRFPPVHPEGRKFAVIAGAIALGFFLLGWNILAWPMVGITVWVAAFFRDPKRVTIDHPQLITAPADGLITLIQEVVPPAEIAGPDGLGDDPLVRVSIFMSVFDVHINRAPIGGTVKRVVYIPGKFLNADLDKASEDNERQHFLIERDDGMRVGFTQIAGLVARRIVPFVKDGDVVAIGQRVGLIRFGSRVDIYLPKGTLPRVVKGQRTVAGETVMAEIAAAPQLTGISQ